MLTADAIRSAAGPEAAEEIFRGLGYLVAPVDVDPEEWRRGGVALPWNGQARLRLASRLAAFDLFTLTGDPGEEQVAAFLRAYGRYNVLTKSVLVLNKAHHIAVFDLSQKGSLRRLDVDLRSPSRHAVDQLNLLAFSGEHLALSRICDRALGREHLTRQFFQRFRTAVAETAEALRDACPTEDPQAVSAEALLLLSRLLFLTFVQQKGWLNRERRFLVDRLERSIEQGREFFASTLIPLFFGCLNTPLTLRTADALDLGTVPYLNGGLFEPSAFEVRNRDLHLPNGLLQRVIEGVFERFDFSVDERDSAGAHVDPEMLGKVFESLMEADERTASGSFYTPKAIVDVLVDRAVTAWLDRAEEPPGNPAQVLRRLEQIRVLDPACGSGAFLLSALATIERVYCAYAAAAGESVPVDLRTRIVERSLFGVDVKAEAVRLCELRLWLAIVSETSCSAELVRPLPNLDRNILQGNSLLGPSDFLGDARLDLYAEWAGALAAQRDLVDRYRHAAQAERPALYRMIRGNDRRLVGDLLVRAIEADEHELARATAPRRDLFG
ncbi:MAG: N-6 DNA methylase, partial [Thermoanaerobaculia bacterium]